MTLIRAGDVAAGEGFDPWRCASAFLAHLAEPGNDAARAAMWREMDLCYAAEDAYTGPLMRGPRLQRGAARRCLELRAEIEAGDGNALMEAVCSCAAHFLVMPGWLAAEFSRRWHSVQHGEARSWDEAFGKPHPKGANRAGIKARRIDAAWAYEKACSALEQDPSRALDRGLYEEVGKAIGRGGPDGGSHSETARLIQEYIKEHPEMAPLAYIRAQCASGMTAGEARARWEEERFEAEIRAAGLERAPDGSLVPVSSSARDKDGPGKG